MAWQSFLTDDSLSNDDDDDNTPNAQEKPQPLFRLTDVGASVDVPGLRISLTRSKHCSLNCCSYSHSQAPCCVRLWDGCCGTSSWWTLKVGCGRGHNRRRWAAAGCRKEYECGRLVEYTSRGGRHAIT